MAIIKYERSEKVEISEAVLAIGVILTIPIILVVLFLTYTINNENSKVLMKKEDTEKIMLRNYKYIKNPNV